MTETNTERRNDSFSESVSHRLKTFQSEQDVYSKGRLSLVIQFTHMAADKEFPLRKEDFQTDSKGQVSGIGGGNLKRILQEHGITRQLTSEGGRTSRGSMGLMMAYVDFLNKWHEEESVNLSEAENFWAEEVRRFFSSRPFILTADTTRTLRANLDDLFEQARKREQQNKGTRYLGAMLQHLVAAKLQAVLPDGAFEIHGASVADSVTDRSGDFVINNTIIHCTTMTGDLLMEKCKRNLTADARPVIITIYDRVHTALTMLEDADLSGRVEVWDIQQFLSSNILEHSLFVEENRNTTLADIINRYNKIIETVENDPSLRIEFNAN
ncbi:DUF4928 family protein [bacterium]|nr:DUF4928 family protein [bacterium]